MQFDLDPPDLRDPAVVIAFSGWNDAANAASDLVERLSASLPGTELPPIDDETYFDFAHTRPVLRREADGPWIQWPGVRFRLLRHVQRDILVVLGPEPNLKWKSFCQHVTTRILSVQPSIAITVGAMLSDTPHSRPFPIGLYTGSTQLQERFGFATSEYTGPTGIIGVLGQALEQAMIPTAALWVSVPAYVSNPPNPKAQLQLMERLEQALDLTFDHGDLESQAAEWLEAVNALASQDPEIEHYIQQLEEASDQEVVEESSGDRIAAEFERYLRGRKAD